MDIYGIQKMTLLDYPGHVACTVFFGGCDFRCPFCHNYELVCMEAAPVMDHEELLEYLKKRAGLIDGVVLTGGEPTLQRELMRLTGDIKSLGYRIKLDTNGYHPEALKALIGTGNIDYVAMDIKSSPGKYAAVCGVVAVDIKRIEKSIEIIMEEAPDYEFRTTVVGGLHTLPDFEEIGRMISGAKKYYLQAFEDRETVPYSGFEAPDERTLEGYAGAVRPFVEAVSIRGI